MMKLTVAFCKFENAPKNIKTCKLKLNIIILSSTTFLQKSLLPPTPRRVH